MNLTECIPSGAENAGIARPPSTEVRSRWARLPAREFQKGLAEKLKQYRIRRCWTQTDLSNALKLQGFKVHIVQISRAENGLSVGLATIRALRAFLRGQKGKG